MCVQKRVGGETKHGLFRRAWQAGDPVVRVPDRLHVLHVAAHPVLRAEERREADPGRGGEQVGGVAQPAGTTTSGPTAPGTPPSSAAPPGTSVAPPIGPVTGVTVRA